MSLLADQNRARMARRGLSMYDPTGRTARRSAIPSRRTTQPPKPTNAQSNAQAILAKAHKANGIGGGESDDDGGGLAESFFKTGFGSGLGTLINNPVVKSLLQPLDILGVPQRAIASTINEVGDLFAGEGFSPQDWIDQTNPDAWFDGNHEGSIGMGDVWQKHGKALGAGDNRWLDAVVGFTGDVLTDPLTYVGGVGVLDKGLDGLRSGSRLGSAFRATLGDGKDLTKALDRVDRVNKGANPSTFTNEAAGKGSRASLAGRPIRTRRTSQAYDMISKVEEASPGMLDTLYGGTDVGKAALAEIQQQAGRGLGAFSPGLEAPVRELVETALNIKAPALRARVPLARQQGLRVAGTEGLMNKAGDARQRFNRSSLGRKMIDAKSWTDEERAMRAITSGDLTSPEDFARASRHINAVEGTRAPAGEFLVTGLNMARGQRKNMLTEIKSQPGKNLAEKNAAYIARAETADLAGAAGETRTVLNQIFDELRESAAASGVTIPKLSDGGLNYLPHVFAPEFRRTLKTSKGQIFADDLVARMGGEVEQDLLKESGRLSGRNIRANMDLQVPGAPEGVTFNTGDGSIGQINANVAAKMRDNGIKPVRILEDSPMTLVDDYIQAMSEDVGRRVSRAEQIALGNKDVRYNPDNFVDDPDMPARAGWADRNMDEAFAEQRAASDRLGLNESDDDIYMRIMGQSDEVLDSRRKAKDSRIAHAAAKKSDDRLKAATRRGAVSFEDVDGMEGFLGTEGLPAMVEDAFADWMKVDSNKRVMMHPEADNLWKNFQKEIKDPGMLMRVYRELNKYFKNFAVLTPGFHVRNGLSAIFMNIADGVPLQTTGRGIKLWKEFSKASKNGTDLNSGRKFIADLAANGRSRDAEALRSVFASGAGGRFTEAGLVEGAASKLSRKLTENRVTRSSQDAGAFVEGAVRTGMALDTVENGGSIADAAARITRVQFDYSQTSRTDDTMKQIMPFYSFMSRNIPLQVMQTWSRPQAYVAYEHFKNNFGQPEVFEGREGEIPGYIEDGGGMPFNLGPFGNWLEPDLPHTRVTEDIERYANVLKDPLGATSGMSPVLTAPLEFGFRKDAFTGQNFNDDDLEHVSNPLEMLAVLPAWATGTLKQKDGQMFIEKRTLNALQALDPTFSRAGRLSGSTGKEPERVAESWLRLFGAPVRNITEKQMRNATLSREFDESDELAVQRAMERALRPDSR